MKSPVSPDRQADASASPDPAQPHTAPRAQTLSGRSERLNGLTRRMATDREPDAFLRCLLEEITAEGFVGAALLLAEQHRMAEQHSVPYLTTLPEPTAFLPLCRPQFAVSMTQRESLVRADGPQFSEAERRRFQQENIAALLLISLVYQQQPIGTLVVCAPAMQSGGADTEAQFFTPEDLSYLGLLADFAALTLGHALLHREQQEAHSRLAEHHSEVTAQTQDLVTTNAELLATQAELAAQYRALEEANRQMAARATTDGMTGLANHRAFQEELHRQVARNNRSTIPLTLILLDVDRFKQYNDAFGHPAGDEVLKTVGALLREAVREGDFPARYGGEEFAIILPETDAETAQQVAERIRSVVECHTFPHRAVTVSLGVAQHFVPETSDAVIQRADVALYEAKSAGRNRTVFVPMPADENDETANSETVLTVNWSEKDGPSPCLTETPHRAGEGEEAEDLHHLMAEACFEPAAASLLTGGLEGLLQFPLAQVLSSLLDSIDRRSAEPQGHSERVARYSLRLAQAVNEVYEEQRNVRPLLPRLNSGDLIALAFGAVLHDIGKLGISDSVLRKRGQLSEDEWRQVRRHPLVGAEILSSNPLLARGLPVVRYHHERWDGTGYPQGLAGEAIPLPARIFALCDTLEILTSERPYRSRMDYTRAREEIVRGVNTQFDPDVVAAFLRVPEEQWLLLGSAERLAPLLPFELPRAA